MNPEKNIQSLKVILFYFMLIVIMIVILIVFIFLTRRVGLDEKAGAGEGHVWLWQLLLYQSQKSKLLVSCFTRKLLHSNPIIHTFPYATSTTTIYIFFGNNLERCKRSRCRCTFTWQLAIKSCELCPGLTIFLSTAKNVLTFIKYGKC